MYLMQSDWLFTSTLQKIADSPAFKLRSVEYSLLLEKRRCKDTNALMIPLMLQASIDYGIGLK